MFCEQCNPKEKKCELSDIHCMDLQVDCLRVYLFLLSIRWPLKKMALSMSVSWYKIMLLEMNLRTLGCHLLQHKHYSLRYGRGQADEQQSSSQQHTCNGMSSSSLVVFTQIQN